MQNYTCKNCGAELYWNTKSQSLKCQYCDTEYKVSDFEDATLDENAVIDETVEIEYTNAQVDEDMVVYHCDNCGGEVIALKTTMATICPYCSEAISITSKSVGNFRPSVCIPFAVDKKHAIELYETYVKRSFLTPKAFKENNTIEKIQGLFTPFHLHSMTNAARHQITGEVITHKRVGYDRITTHEVYDVNMQTSGEFNRIPVDGARRVSNKLMEAIEPFNYTTMKDYNPAYMSGYVAEQIDDDEDDMRCRAEDRTKQIMQQRALNTHYDLVMRRITNSRYEFSDQISEYAMLPVWLLNVKHRNKKYTFAINGQTGKITGTLPLDGGKLSLICAGLFVGMTTLFAFLLGGVV